MKELHFFEEASEEAEEARRWYRQRSEPAETVFLKELDHATAVVVEAPQRWPKHIAGTPRCGHCTRETASRLLARAAAQVITAALCLRASAACDGGASRGVGAAALGSAARPR